MFWSDVQGMIGRRVVVEYGESRFGVLQASGEVVAVDNDRIVIDTGLLDLQCRRSDYRLTINGQAIVEQSVPRAQALVIEVKTISAAYPNGQLLQWILIPSSIVELEKEPGVALAQTIDGRTVRLVRSEIVRHEEIEI